MLTVGFNSTEYTVDEEVGMVTVCIVASEYRNLEPFQLFVELESRFTNGTGVCVCMRACVHVCECVCAYACVHVHVCVLLLLTTYEGYCCGCVQYSSVQVRPDTSPSSSQGTLTMCLSLRWK